ncbi:MAG: EMC3/TMCO1 family protein, partial [Candidatus Ranarchaeia archaeon]
MEQKTWIILLILIIAAIIGITVFNAFIVPWISTVLNPFIATVLAPYAQPPASTLFIFVLSLGISMITQLVNRLLTDADRRNRILAEMKKFQELQRRAKRTGDKKLLIKVERRQKYIQKLQSEMMKMQFRPTLYFFVPFIILFQLLGGFYTDHIIAILPFDIRYFLPDFLLFSLGQGIDLPPVGISILHYQQVFGLRFFF